MPLSCLYIDIEVWCLFRTIMRLLLFRFKWTNKMLTCTLVPEHLNFQWSSCCSISSLWWCLVCLFSFGNCIVCPSVFWQLYCLSFCLLAIVLSVLLRFTDSGYSFGILNTFLVWRLVNFHYIFVILFPFIILVSTNTDVIFNGFGYSFMNFWFVFLF